MIEHGSAGMDAGGLSFRLLDVLRVSARDGRAARAIRTIAERGCLTVIKKFDDCFSQSLARVSCPYDAAVLLALRGRERNYAPFRRNIVRTLDAVRIVR